MEGIARSWPVAAVKSRSVIALLCGALAVTTALATRCASVAREHGVRFGFIDQAGALKGYASGAPTGPSCFADAWRLGVDPRAVAVAVDSYIALAYAKSPERVASDVAGYAGACADTPLRCVLRHGGPDFTTASDLRAKVNAARENGAAAIDFYHYGLMPLSGLDAAAAAIGS